MSSEASGDGQGKQCLALVKIVNQLSIVAH